MKKFKIVWREWRRCPKGIAMLIISFLAQTINTMCWSAMIVVLPSVFDHLDNLGHEMIRIGLLIIGIMVTSSLGVLATVGRNAVSSSSVEYYMKYVEDADYDLFTEMSCSSIAHSGDIIWRISAVGRCVITLLVQIGTIIIRMYSIYLLFPALALPIFLVYSICFVGIWALYTVFQKLDTKGEEIAKSRIAEFNETVYGFAEVRAFCTQKHHLASMIEKNTEVMHLICKKNAFRVLASLLFCFTDGAGTLLAVWFMGNAILAGTVSPATAIAIVAIIWELTNPIDAIVNIIEELSTQLAMVDKFAEVIEYQNQTATGTIKLDRFDRQIEVKGLSFQYRDSDSTLRDINLVIPKGKRVGICGASGGGKSTLFKLLAKYYDPSQGSIQIDGIDYRDLDVESLRQHIGIVHQENHIFEGTIYENVIYGNWNCSEYDVIEACKKANLYDFIQKLPEKFQTKVGPNGLKLSGGQKQRIALARVFLSNAEIILLDEATSALDNESESLVQEALTRLEGKTVITIAHRLSTIKDSDIIHVIDGGRIVESGTHEELLSRNGIYKSLQK